MKYIVAILLTFITSGLFAQGSADLALVNKTRGGENSRLLDKAIADFDKALISRDSVALKTLLSNDIYYGHSNGWIETKKELIEDLYNGKLIYKTIVPKIEHKQVEGNSAAVRSYAEIDCVMDGSPMSFKLKVLQMWVWKNGHWELFARQSVKI